MHPTERYTAPAMALHWLIALAIAGLFCFGLYMHELPLSPEKLRYYSWHKWGGITVLALAALRLLWRLTHYPPPLPLVMPAWQRLAANGMHHLLYLLMFAIPLSGWMMSSAKGFPVVWFGVLPLPDLVGKDKVLGDLLATLHGGLNYTLAALVLAHAAAALKHHFIDRDDVLTRMLPGPRRKERNPS